MIFLATILSLFFVTPISAQTISLISAVGPSQTAQGDIANFTVSMKSNFNASNLNLQFFIKNQPANAIIQKILLTPQSLTSGVTKNFSVNYQVPVDLAPGDYCLTSSAFDATWAKNYFWVDCSVKFKIVAPALSVVSASGSSAQVYQGASLNFSTVLKSNFSTQLSQVQFRFRSATATTDIYKVTFSNQTFTNNVNKTFNSSYLVPKDLAPGDYCITSSAYNSTWSKTFLWQNCSIKFSVLKKVSQYAWKPLRVGAGGWLVGMDASPNGQTRVVRADTYGAYILDGSTWRQLITKNTLPASEVALEKNATGVYEIRVAPSDSNRLYMAFSGYLYMSTNRGVSFTRTAMPYFEMNANDAFRIYAQKMAVDPSDPNIVYVGTPKTGLFVTYNAGVSFTKVASVPVSKTVNGGFPGITGIVFDKSAGLLNGRTKTIYASSYGNGIYRSIDAGVTWNKLSGGPATVNHAVVTSTGLYLCTTLDQGSRYIYRFEKQGSFTQLDPGAVPWHSITINPQNPLHVVLGSAWGNVIQSFNGGDTWSATIWTSTRVSPTIPWLAWTKEESMSNGTIQFDPLVPNKLWFSQGIGVWTTTLTPTTSQVTWTANSTGIEQIVANEVHALANGSVALAGWDRGFFVSANSDVFPARHYPTKNVSVSHGWAIDSSPIDPKFIVGIASNDAYNQNEDSGFSLDSGLTWSKFATLPAWGADARGTIAVGNSQNIVWVPSGQRQPYFTKNRGGSWSPVNLPGVSNDATGWGGLYKEFYMNRHIVAADQVANNVFYIYHTPKGLFRTTDGGSSWVNVFAGEISPISAYSASIKAVPNHEGHLFFTSGHLNGATPYGDFKQSTDGGVTWTAVPNVSEVAAFGFGKAAPGQAYPTIFIAGYVNSIKGVYRSDDQGATWVKTVDYPIGSLDQIKSVDGDKNVFGKVYIGFMGSGYAYGALY